jgi:O-antigen ligase
MIWLLIGYMWLFIHRPFEIWPGLAAVHIERVYMIVTLAWWLARGAGAPKEKSFPVWVLCFVLVALATWGQCVFELRPDLGTFPFERVLLIPFVLWFMLSQAGASKGHRLHWCLLAFLLAMLASWAQCPFPECGDATVDEYLKYAVFYVLLVTSVRDRKDLARIIAGYTGVMAVFMAHCLREYLCGRAIYAQGITRLKPVGVSFDFNDFAGLIVASLPFVMVVWRRWPGRTMRTAMLAYLCLSGVCIALTGSRMGFIGVVLAGLLGALASRHRWRMLALYPVVMALAWAVLPPQQQDRFMTLFDPSRGPKESAGSAGRFRYGGFERALPVFAERPVWGFGPQSFGVATGKHMMPHNLYGQVLAELGVVGAIAFGMMAWAVMRNAFEARRLARQLPAGSDFLAWDTVLSSTGAYLLLLIMAWGFNFLFWHVWLWFGGFQIVALQCLREQAAGEPAKEIETVVPALAQFPAALSQGSPA